VRVRDERIRDRIVDAVVEMIDEHGWEHITVRRIGERMHYAASTIVYHVGSLEELIAGVRTRVAEQLVLTLFAGDVQGPNRGPEAAERLLGWMGQHPKLLAFFVMKAPTDDSLQSVNAMVPTTFAPAGRGWPKAGTLRYFDRALQCALEGTLLLDDCPDRQRDFLATELLHLEAQWHRLVMTT